MKHINSFNKLIFEYNTGPIPPPFCHKYKIIITKDNQENYQVELSIDYYDRAELTEEEVFEEGFFLDDDYSWEGSLPTVWGNEIEKKLSRSNWKKKKSARNDGSEFIIKVFQNNQSEVLQPADGRIWEIFVHEIIQVIYEVSKKESPLKIRFFSNAGTDNNLKVDFTFSFAERVVLINSSERGKNSMNWEEGQKLLKYIFNIDYLPENSMETIPKKLGNYISPGDGLWYELASNETVHKGTADRIGRLIHTLGSYG